MNVRVLLANTIYLIHTCPERKDFVDNYLVPALKMQGIEKYRIFIYNDEYKLGNLQAYIKAAELVREQRDNIQVVHLQDDIIPCSNFREQIEYDYNDLCEIVCGFSSQYDDISRYYIQKPEKGWFSFQCIKFSNKMLQDFIRWLKTKGKEQHKNWWDAGKYDDSFFKEYIKTLDLKVMNLNPTIVQCVDDVLGGSLINGGRGFKMKSPNFNDYATEKQFYDDYKNNIIWKDKLDKNNDNISYKFK